MNHLKKPFAGGGASAPKSSSRLLTDFEIVQSLGSGAFGLVCKLRSKLDKRNYAVKVVPFEENNAHDLREVENLARLPTHPNVVLYFTCWKDCISKEELERVKGRLGVGAGKDLVFRMNRGQTHLDLLCIQMELCSEDLRKWLARQRIVLELKSVEIFLQICAGLEHIHAHQLIHRDLKPENIFFSVDGLAHQQNVKIGDLGLAIGHTAQMSALHTRGAGTPLYWAPEQESKKYSRQADLYSLGLILYELFEPSLQPRGIGNHQNYEPLIDGFKQLKFNAVLPSQMKSKWPKVADLILKLVSVNPSDRPGFPVIRQAIAPPKEVPTLVTPARRETMALKEIPPPARPRPSSVQQPKLNEVKPVQRPPIRSAAAAAAAIQIPVPTPRVTPMRPVPAARRSNPPTQATVPLPAPRRVIATPELPPVPKQRVLPAKRASKSQQQQNGNDDEPCAHCYKPILGGEKLVQALGRVWHPEHFLCAHCRAPLKDGFYEKDGLGYCKKDYEELHLPKCAGCKKPIEKGLITVDGVNWHRDHFICMTCRKPIGGNPYYLHESRVYCKTDYLKCYAPKCPGCRKPIEYKYIELSDKDPGAAMFGVDKQKWHLECVVCTKCKKRIGGAEVKAYNHEGKLYCETDYVKHFAPKCLECRKPIEGSHVIVRDNGLGGGGPQTWHHDCFKCSKCRSLIGDTYTMYQNRPICTFCQRINALRDK